MIAQNKPNAHKNQCGEPGYAAVCSVVHAGDHAIPGACIIYYVNVSVENTVSAPFGLGC